MRLKGDWEGWIAFFLEGVAEVASNATEAARQILAIFDVDGAILQKQGRRASTLLRVHTHFQAHPYSTISMTAKRTGLSFPATSDAIRTLTELKILGEISGRARDRIYAYTRYLAILSEGAAPL